jgi:glutathione transport system permease protein
LALPAATLAAAGLGTIARFARSSLLETFGNDYIRTAHAKGLAPRRVIGKHAIRNALIPVLTIVGLQFGFLLSGTVIVETVFNFHGLGWLLIQSIEARDYPVIQGLLLVFSLQFVLINLVVDMLYAVIDPRISYG